MKNTLFTTLTLATAAAAGITALALHAPPKVDCSCDEHAIIEVAPPKPIYEFHHHHFAEPPTPEPMPRPEPTVAA